MFGIGFVEIAIIVAIALIVIGPEKLPDMMKVVGRTFGEFKRAAEDVRKSMNEVEDDLSLEEKEKDVELDEDLKREREERERKKEREKADDGHRRRT